MVVAALKIDKFNSMIEGLNPRSRSIVNGNSSTSPTSSVSAPFLPPAPAPAPATSTPSGPWPMEIGAVKTNLVGGHIPAAERERRNLCGRSGHPRLYRGATL